MELFATTLPNSRDSYSYAELADIETFTEKVSGMAWFAHLGEPSPWDQMCVRLWDWSDWGGPEVGTEQLSCQAQAIHDQFVVTDSLSQYFDQVTKEVVPFDDEEDAWHAPNTAVWMAAWCVGLISVLLTIDTAVPPDLMEQWAWYATGHWPSGYEEPLAEVGQRLIVL